MIQRTHGLPALLATSLFLLSGSGAAQVAKVPSAEPGIASMEFVRIPAGEFQMGCSPGDTECDADEKPAHRVRITKAFELGKYEVTQAQWEAVMEKDLSTFKGPDRPVETASLVDVQEFLRRVNGRLDGYRYRLPTEAEWEYAARAGSSEKHVGPVDAVAWYGRNSGDRTHPVGQKQPNAWGLYDMQGNVWEWCQDGYNENYYKISPAEDPPGPASAPYVVVRGGSWSSNASRVRVSRRDSLANDFWINDLGFRCVRERY